MLVFSKYQDEIIVRKSVHVIFSFLQRLSSANLGGLCNCRPLTHWKSGRGGEAYNKADEVQYCHPITEWLTWVRIPISKEYGVMGRGASWVSDGLSKPPLLQ